MLTKINFGVINNNSITLHYSPILHIAIRKMNKFKKKKGQFLEYFQFRYVIVDRLSIEFPFETIGKLKGEGGVRRGTVTTAENLLLLPSGGAPAMKMSSRSTRG